MDNTMLYNAEEVAYNFYGWLIEMNYCDKDDKIEDIQNVAPKLFNLLRSISGWNGYFKAFNQGRNGVNYGGKNRRYFNI